MGLLLLLPAALINLVTADVYNLLKKEILLVWKVDDKFKELQEACMEIEDMLAKLERRHQFINNNNILEVWLQELESYWYDMEDLIHHLLMCLSLQKENKRGAKKAVRDSILKSGEVNIPRKIRELLKKSGLLKQQIRDLTRQQEVAPNTVQPHQYCRNSSVPHYPSIMLDETPFVSGTLRKKDKDTIIKRLNSKHLHGVSIIGIDGLGKTSLARSIAQTIQLTQVDETNPNGFMIILSARVSNDFKVGDVVHKLVEDHLRRTSSKNLEAPPQEKDYDIFLKELLRGKKSLIVLDDLWDVLDEEWDHFKCEYLSSSTCWRILTTTRNQKVADVTQSKDYYLGIMPNEDCGELIKEKGKLSRFHENIWATYVEEISAKCKGMPIVANKIGLILNRKESGDKLKESLAELKQKEIWELPELQQVFPYNNLNEPVLPPYLRRCFAYCSLFPSDHLFDRDYLIQLWEAEGFIHPSKTASLKQPTNRPFDDLLSRSVFQPSTSGDNKQPVYKMHVFNHEFAHLLASKAFCRLDKGSLSSCEYIRHLSLNHESTDKELFNAIEQCKGLRTFLLPQQGKPKTRKFPENFYAKLKRLVLLDLNYTIIGDLSKATLPIHLRYLDLSNTKIKKLPKSITSLFSLKVLKLKGCSDLRELPKDLNELISLTHLYVNMKSFYRMPSNMGELTRLEVLGSFVVGKDEEHKITQLSSMEHLREIQISGLEKIGNKEEATEANLSGKLWLRTLVLEWSSDEQVDNAGAVLEGLQPDKNLHDLELINYGGQSFPEWLTSPSCLLVSIFLNRCDNCHALPSLGRLQVLKNLVLHRVSKVKDLGTLFCRENGRKSEKGTQFNCLELLQVGSMEALVEWTGLEAGDMPRLRDLQLESCGLLVNLPSFEHLSCLINLEIRDCPKLLSLPQLTSSLNGEFGKLTVEDCKLVSNRCFVGGEDWPKIKNIPDQSRQIFPKPKNPKSSSLGQLFNQDKSG